MSVYIGRNPTYGVFAKQSIIGNNANTSFTIDYDIPSENALLVVDNGQIKNPGVDYTAVGTTLTFSYAPPSANTVYVVFLGTSIVQPTLSPGYTTLVESFTGDGSTTTFSLSELPATSSSIIVFVDGIIQKIVTNYNLSGSSLIFTSAPDNNADIDVVFLSKSRFTSDIPADGTISRSSLTAEIQNSIFETSEKTSNFSANSGNIYIVNTLSNAVTATLPSSPAIGEMIKFVDGAGTFGTNNLTVNRNGRRIMGLLDNLVVNYNNAGFTLIYYNAAYGWRLMEN